MRDKFEFQYQLTYDDLRKTAVLAFKANKTLKYYNLNIILAFVAINLLLPPIFELLPFDIDILYYNLISVVLACVYLRSFLVALKKEYSFLPILQKNTILRFTSSSYYEENDGAINILPYQHLKLLENKDYFLCLHNIAIVMPIPKRLFEQEADINEFRDFIYTKSNKSSA